MDLILLSRDKINNLAKPLLNLRNFSMLRGGFTAFCISSATLFGCSYSMAGEFNMNLGANPDWPAGSNGPVTFTLTDEFGFELDGSATINQTGGTAVAGFPLNEVGFFGTSTSIGAIWDSNAGSSGIGEATNTATLSFSSGGVAFPTDGISFVISDIDSVDNNSTTDRCDFITATGNAGNPTLSLVNPASAATSVRIGPATGSGATGPIAANQAQCIYNTGATASPNSAGDDNGSILVSYPTGTSSATILYDESIENVLGNNNLNAAARGIGIWASSVITVNQSISLAKTADVPSYANAGDTINYTYVVTNDGPLPINTNQNIQINDDQIGIINCPAIAADIPVGGTQTCTGTYTVTAGDASAPNVVNVATAGVGTGTQPFADRLQSNSDTATVIREIPAITLSKSSGVPSVAAGALPGLTDAGDTIVYSYTVNNTGNVPIQNVTITDPGPSFNGNAGTGSLSAFTPASATIPLGGSQVFTATYTLSQQDVDNSAGITNGVSNTASSTGQSVGGVTANSNNSTAQTTITGGPNIIVTKTASDDTNVPAGVTVTYTYTVTNTGNQTVSNINLTDAHGGSGPMPTPSNETLTTDVGATGDSTDAAVNGSWDSLAPGDQVTFTANYTVTQNDIDTLQ
jgi:uncharacterized repeat protein (TIGR01451 family)